jgi:hypothetical protein
MYKNKSSKPQPCRDPKSYTSNPCNYTWCKPSCPKPHRKDEKCENVVNINNSVQITQTNQAEANGGAGGSGGSAAAAGAIGERIDIDVNASASTENENKIENETDQNFDALGTKAAESSEVTPEDAEALQDEEGTNTISNSASGGSGGSGGAGGSNSQSNSASVSIDNCTVVMVSCDGNSPSTTLTLGRTDRQVDVKIDEDGNTYVNGKKMDEVALENGTKVFIFRDSEVKKSEPEPV